MHKQTLQPPPPPLRAALPMPVSARAWHSPGAPPEQARLARVEQQIRSEAARRKREGFKQQVKVRPVGRWAAGSVLAC